MSKEGGEEGGGEERGEERGEECVDGIGFLEGDSLRKEGFEVCPFRPSPPLPQNGDSTNLSSALLSSLTKEDGFLGERVEELFFGERIGEVFLEGDGLI